MLSLWSDLISVPCVVIWFSESAIHSLSAIERLTMSSVEILTDLVGSACPACFGSDEGVLVIHQTPATTMVAPSPYIASRWRRRVTALWSSSLAPEGASLPFGLALVGVTADLPAARRA